MGLGNHESPLEGRNSEGLDEGLLFWPGKHESVKPRVLLCHKLDMTRRVLSELLKTEGLLVVGECVDDLDWQLKLVPTEPNVLITDMLPKFTQETLFLIRTMRDIPPPTELRIIITDFHRDQVLFNKLFESPFHIDGFVRTGTPLPTLLKAIETVLEGKRYIDPSLYFSVG